MVDWTNDMSSTEDLDENRRLGDAYAIALLQWPAIIGWFALDGEGWQLMLKIALGLWVVLLSLAVTFGRRKAGMPFGMAMTLSALCVAGACFAHPGPWLFCWLFLLTICFYAAQRARLQEPYEETGRAK